MKKYLAAICITILGLGVPALASAGGLQFGNTTNNNQTYNEGGHGGNVSHSGNSWNSNRNENKNSNWNSNHNSNSNRNYNTNFNKQHQGQFQGQGQKQGQKQSTANANNASQGVSFQQNYEAQKYAPDVSAPGLAASSGTCLGSVSGGGSGSIFGFAFGLTIEDKQCQLRRNAALLKGMGRDKAAIALLCTDASFAQALGSQCGQTAEAKAKKTAARVLEEDRVEQTGMTKDEYEVYLMGRK